MKCVMHRLYPRPPLVANTNVVWEVDNSVDITHIHTYIHIDIHTYMHAPMHTYIHSNIHTVQTFNSCTSRPDVCQCLVVQSPIDNMSNNRPSTSMTHVATFICEDIHASMPRKRGGNRACGRVLCPGCPHT